MQIATLPAVDPFLKQVSFGLLIALFLGLLSLVAVASMRMECSTTSDFLLTTDGKYLVTESHGRIIIGQKRQCDLLAGSERLPLTSWAALSALGLSEWARASR